MTFDDTHTQRWLHIALVRQAHRVKLYVNGIADAQNSTSGRSVANESPLFIGGVPWLRDVCNVELVRTTTSLFYISLTFMTEYFTLIIFYYYYSDD